MSEADFFKNIRDESLRFALDELARKAHGAAASIVDPQTGKHADVFVRRKSPLELSIRTRGSPEFARELERRLGVDPGAVDVIPPEAAADPVVYLAHASEDHETLAKPLAEALMAKGIDVWLDEWEIRPGDSLRQRMEEGLAKTTHFVVLLTPASLTKAWVNREIDAGFVRVVGGESRFIGLRLGVPVSGLSPFLKTLLCPDIDLNNPASVEGLVADIYGVSKRPVRGPVPNYVQPMPDGLRGWSSAAVAVAQFLVVNSRNGGFLDPQTNPAAVAEATNLPVEDIRLGVLDLKDAGLVEETKTLGSDGFWPTTSLFPVFDAHFLDFDPARDAVAVANLLVSQAKDQVEAQMLASELGWEPRRLNSALSYLEDARVISPSKAIGTGPYNMFALRRDDRTRRFVRDHS